MNKFGAALSKFREDPDSALDLLRSEPSYLSHDEEKHRAISAEEARKLFEAERIRVIDIYAVCGLMDILHIPEKVQKSRNWDKIIFKQTTEMLLKLSKEPSVKGMSRHLVLYGEKV